VLGLVFIAAGALKIGHASDLAATITAFGFGLPPVLVAVAAIALPPAELLLGVYLIGGWLLPFTSVIASALLALFIGVVASVVARGLHVSCGCFGAADTAPATWWTVVRDAVILIPAIYLMWWSRTSDD
jgi:putative oxidoreductase